MAALTAPLLSGFLCAGLHEVEARLDTERISLKLQDARVIDILSLYKQLLGVEVKLACLEERRVTVTFENITVRTSLNAICESAGLRWKLLEKEPPLLQIECGEQPPETPATRLPILPAKPKTTDAPSTFKVARPVAGSAGDRMDLTVSVSLNAADLNQALQVAAQLLDARLLLDAGLSGKKISLEMSQSRLRDFLDAVCRQAGASWSLRPGKEPILAIDPKK